MVEHEDIAGRAYARVYRVSGKRDLNDFLVEAVRASGARVLHASSQTRAPVYIGAQLGTEERIGMLIYPFRCNPPPIKGRAPDEHRVQVRYGGEPTWDDDHPIGRDVAGVDVTLVLGVHLDAGIVVGLDPLLYDALPMGISVEFKDEHVQRVLDEGWHAWDRVNVPGVRRATRRAPEGLETLVAFEPSRLIDYVRLEREAASLGLDPPLRLRAAEAAFTKPRDLDLPHVLEERFQLSSQQILDIIDRRLRLKVAVRGGVAEAHLERHLRQDPDVATVRRLDKDGEPDFEVSLRDGRVLRLECKNCSPTPYKDGSHRVEVQKTRVSKGDPASRYYGVTHFDAVAACLFPETGAWEFRFQRSELLDHHDAWPDRIKPLQRVDETWADRFPQLW